jgi:hypothetical protein
LISWWSVLLVDKTKLPEKITDKLYHIMLHRVQLATLVVIGSDSTGS